VRIAYTIARLLLGAIFLFFGSNLFLNFLHAPMPTGTMGQFAGALSTSHYFYPVAFFQLVPAVLLLLNRYVPLGLTLLAPVIVNICLVHILMAPSGLPVAALVVILWLLVFYRVRSAFAGIFERCVPDAA
jgi:putative oxidoreductase